MQEALDITIIVLLVVAIVYGFRLNQQIKLVKDSKQELASLFKSFDNTILKAQQGIAELKEVSTEVSQGLQQQIDKGSLLLDDLSFVSEKAADISTKVIKHLEAMSKVPLPQSATKAEPSIPKKISGPLTPDEVLKLRKQHAFKDTSPQPAKKSSQKPSKKEKTQALENLLTQIAQKKQQPPKNDNRSQLSAPLSVSDTLKTLGFGDKS